MPFNTLKKLLDAHMCSRDLDILLHVLVSYKNEISISTFFFILHRL